MPKSQLQSIVVCLAALIMLQGCALRRHTHERLHGVLWTQTSGEYWALASTAYREAQKRLESALTDTSLTAATEQTGSFSSLPTAVVLDLDETVLDNSRVQAQLILDKTDYLTTTWDAWVDREDAGLVPGAKEFIDFALSKKVAVFFITNRTNLEQAKTLANLAKLNISATDETVLCTGENGWTSDKTARRAEIAKTHRIALLIGDDMNDFISTAKLAPPERIKLATTYSSRWGNTWVLIPNPIYGSWERSLYPGLTKDKEILKKKKQQVRGFR